MEPTFVSMDLESSLGIIKDEDEDIPTFQDSREPPMPPPQGSLVCHPTNNTDNAPVLDPTVVVLPMLLDPKLNPAANQKVTRTSDTYPFANQDGKRKEEEKEEEEDPMDESDNHNHKEKETSNNNSPRKTSMSSFEPIPVSDEASGDIGMMMLMQDDETQDVLVNKTGDWSESLTKTPRNERNGYNIVPNDDAWVNLDLTETDVDDEDDLLSMLEEEAKETGFVLENIGDRQAFWNYNEWRKGKKERKREKKGYI